jgi:hypothetical protein
MDYSWRWERAPGLEPSSALVGESVPEIWLADRLGARKKQPVLFWGSIIPLGLLGLSGIVLGLSTLLGFSN